MGRAKAAIAQDASSTSGDHRARRAECHGCAAWEVPGVQPATAVGRWRWVLGTGGARGLLKAPVPGPGPVVHERIQPVGTQLELPEPT